MSKIAIVFADMGERGDSIAFNLTGFRLEIDLKGLPWSYTALALQ